MTILEIFKQLIATGLEALRGPCTVSEVHSFRNEIECLIGYTIDGHSIEIHCLERKYYTEYKNWYIPNNIKSIYRVFTKLSVNTPDKLKDMCMQDHEFPNLKLGWLPSAIQKEAAIQAYLDLLIQKSSVLK